MPVRYVALDPFIDAQVIQAMCRLGIGIVRRWERRLCRLLTEAGGYGLQRLPNLLRTAIAIGEVSDVLPLADACVFQIDRFESETLHQTVEHFMIAIDEFAAQFGHHFASPCDGVRMHATANMAGRLVDAS